MNRVLRLLDPAVDVSRAVDLSRPSPVLLFNALCTKAQDVASWPDMLPTLTATREEVHADGRVPLPSELLALELVTAFASFQATARDLFERRMALDRSSNSSPLQEPIQ